LKLTDKEERVIEAFKQVGIHGQAFRSQDACFAYLERIWKPRIMCPGCGRAIALEACSWHREGQDPLCLGCARQREQETAQPTPLQRYETL